MSGRGAFHRAAQAAARAGFAPIPLPPGMKAPPPLRWPERASADPERVAELWSGADPRSNLGIATGPHSGDLVVLDVDPRHGGGDSFAALVSELGPVTSDDGWPFGWTVETPSGGAHHWTRGPVGFDVPCSAGKLGPGLDVRGVHGYVLAPPSVLADGGRYRWRSAPPGTTRADLQGIPGPRLSATSLPPMAEAWSELLIPAMPDPDELEAGLRNAERVERAEGGSRYGRAAAESAYQRVSAAPVGQRNSALNVESYSLGQLVGGGELAWPATRALLIAAGRAAGLPRREAERTAESGLRAGVLQPRRAPRREAA